MKTLAEKYEKIVNKYVKKFCKKHGYEFEYWIGNDVGDICEVADMFLNFRDIKYDIDTDQPKGNLLHWYYLTVEENLKANYKSYSLGLRPADVIESERVASLEKTQKELKAVEKIFNELVENEVNKVAK